MNTRTPGGTGERTARSAVNPQESMLRVSNEVLQVFGDEYSLSETMAPAAYATFLDNLRQDYSYVLQGDTLFQHAAKEAVAFEQAVQTTGNGSEQTKKAEKALSAKLDEAIGIMEQERGKPFTKEERLATKMLVTRALTAAPPTRNRGTQQQHGTHHGQHAGSQFQDPSQAPPPNSGYVGYEEVNPADNMAPNMPPSRGGKTDPNQQPPSGRVGPKTTVPRR